ncbi:GNAT family N-acetyltransferase [Nocardiopsis kunsanensis]|uniref:N-acetyltransferase n=1 Tax=Nocardiopsis kunsanensis TaxID=141693 RepID=A0A919CFX2_9ACTN|nr:GNAT family N-acetyltransferase [Nocardiopsis kunsanensis]GHD19535.1 N-acetyltransferase [Nocardiopsis kunsanensis]
MTTTDTSPNQPELSYRAATEADAQALSDLVNSCYRGDSSRQGWTTEADLLDGQRVDPPSVRALIQRPDTTVLLAESDRTLVACCELQRGINGTYFGMFSVCPTAQGRGLGARVLAEAEQTAARLWRSRLMRMKVIKQRTELISWYERRGYVGTGRTEPFPYGDPAFGEPKRGDLAFVELTKELDPVV